MEKIGKKRRCRFSTGIVASVVVVLFTVPAFGGYSYTPIDTSFGNEPNHADILSSIYGGTFSKSEVNYSNGIISAFRVYDDDEESFRLNLLTQTLDGQVDQIWTDGAATVTAKVKWAAYNQSFGWNGGGGTGTTYHQLLTDANLGGSGVTINVSGDFLWGYKPNYEGESWEWWSLDSENADDRDHMITYKIEGLGCPETIWLTFMEDLHLSVADNDYNDFVVEISAIPEPATAFMLIAGAVMLLRKR